MKNEMFYGRSWQGVTLDEFIQQVNEYMIWYRATRIKVSLGGMNPAEFRIKMGLGLYSNKSSAPDLPVNQTAHITFTRLS